MKIVLSADDANGVDSIVSPHFGRCPWFIAVTLAGDEAQAIDEIKNPFYGQHQPGQVPGFINSLGADVMLTGGMGGRAVGFFEQMGIEPVTGARGTVRASIEAYLGGELKGAEACATSHEHHADDGAYEKDALGRLKEELEEAKGQLDDITGRLTRLDS